MRNPTLTALAFLLLLPATAKAGIFKCTVADRVEYRDVPCAANAEQQVIEISNDVQSAPPTDPAAVAAQLRQADQALSDRLQQERLLRMQIAAQQAQLDQQERIAEENMAAEQENSNVYVPLYGAPFGAFNHHRIGRHFGHPGNMRPPHQFPHQHTFNGNSFGARAPMRTGSFAANIRF
ncbi:MAG TPA: DUF4124 domain-containing protein [Gammaproteobacteria bacterium]|nr:DUF4124 domain-containing protein [Gammaproteobacteria bacterium]